MRPIYRCRAFEAGQTVVPDQEKPDHIGFVTRGILRIQKTLPDGRQHIVGLLVPGDMYGRVFDGPLHFAIEAATDAEIVAFRRNPFEELLVRSPELERLVLLHILDELDSAREWMMVLANHKVSGRVAGFLLFLCRRWAQGGRYLHEDKGRIEIEVPVSRTDLAHFLGTRQESVSRAVHALSEDGVLRIIDPYRFEILDLRSLVDHSGNEDFIDSDAYRAIEELQDSARRA